MRDIEDLVAKGSGSVGCCTAPRAGTKRGAPPSPEATKRWKPLARTMLAATKKGTGERRLYRGEELRGVHLELTDQCNASCPQCSRNDSGGAVNPLLSLTELRLGDVQAILPVALLQQLRRVMLCGNYGDPIVAKDCKEILRWMQKASPDTRLSMHTNGGARTASWWRDLGSIMRGANFVRFGIDGLEDTNHLYRQKVKWPTLMRNIRAFVSGGGHAQWDYLVFEHNEHQVSEARELATELGFREFSPKKTKRFLDKTNGVVRPSYGVKDQTGTVVRHLRPPKDPEWVNLEVETSWRQLLTTYGSQKAVLNAAEVKCKVGHAGDRSVYVAADGLAWPCCWVAQQHHNDNMQPDSRQVVRLAEQLPGGMQALDARRHSLAEIVEGPLFRVVAGSWSQPTIESGKIKPCASICGTHCGTEMFSQKGERPKPQMLARRPPRRGSSPAARGLHAAARELETWKASAHQQRRQQSQPSEGQPPEPAAAMSTDGLEAEIARDSAHLRAYRAIAGLLVILLVGIQCAEWLGWAV